eukprot:TRINITY_DN9294_c0_g1_i1.p1 TRINITY_DN9294_c0_g1~~TRINITY_DN9294_c0_g1_i1.p1  ORF type:complete len:401 (-),score=67.67 TRINITY_DN9294_c0_g1_i1:49-1218(-)
MANEAYFIPQQLSPITWRVTENDRFRQYPFLYVILGQDKCIIIDTGCGVSDFCSYVTANINKQRLPYLVVCTHCHFDHVGGNSSFQNKPEGLIGVLMGGGDQVFTKNYEINSLCLAHNTKVKDFQVTRWLTDGELIYLDNNDKRKEKSLEVIFTPGHTSDSIALYSHYERRLFVGDLLYPWTAIHLDCIGSNVSKYMESLQKLTSFVKQQEESFKTNPVPPSLLLTLTNPSNTAPTPQSAASSGSEKLSAGQDQMVNEFVSMLELSPTTLSSFSASSLLQLCDWSLEAAVNLYLTIDLSDLQKMCPPSAAPPSVTPSSTEVPPFHTDGIHISCGHVEADVKNTSIFQEMENFMKLIKEGGVIPQDVDGDYGEYSCESFSVILPLKAKWT